MTRTIVVTWRCGPFSGRIDPRTLVFAVLMLAILITMSGFVLYSGNYPLSIAEISTILVQPKDDTPDIVIWYHRLPRLLVGIGAGAAFGLAGALMQDMLRNPLASPDVTGFGAGAACGALCSIMLTASSFWVLPGAIAGGVLSAALVLLLAWKNGLSPARLVLTGLALSLFLMALVDIMMARLDLLTAADAMKWLVGTFSSPEWSDVVLISCALASLGPAALWQGFALKRLALGDDIAAGLGFNVPTVRLWILFLAVGLTACAVGVAGPLPFVAFAANPIARRLSAGFGAGNGSPLLGAAAVGACLTVMADLVCRSLPIGADLPTGVFTTMIGAPLLLWQLTREIRKGVI
ncbi:FecCD family ABC transporter permease [Agrobacterium sp. P15N1-A]|uniref:FecCD family ABC transporter permease n=1 Tax=Agrobacterium sp. P15N1-A TaxID=3342820 RepID=UPI0037D957DF